MKIKYKILTIVVCASVLFSFVCISSSAYGMTENRTDMGNMNYMVSNIPIIIVYGDDIGFYLDPCVSGFSGSSYYGNVTVSVTNWRDINPTPFKLGAVHNMSIVGPYGASTLVYNFTKLVEDGYSGLFNGISLYYDVLDFNYSDKIGVKGNGTVTYSITYNYNEIVDNAVVVNDGYESGVLTLNQLSFSYVDLSSLRNAYNVSVSIYGDDFAIHYLDIVQTVGLASVVKGLSGDMYTAGFNDAVEHWKNNYNPAPWYSDVWEMFSSAVSALFSVKIFGSISIGYIAIIPLAIALFKLFLRVFSGG